ncbi:unnamed protein product [Sphagnum balticum]
MNMKLKRNLSCSFFFLLVFWFLFLDNFRTAEGRPKFNTLFAIGDSYLDTGNRNPADGTQTEIGPVNQDWLQPYGITFPRNPAGRFSDGFLLTDYLATFMGLNPVPYRLYSTGAAALPALRDGVNFAVGGAGVFDNLGFTKTGDQITQLKELVTAGVYDPSFMADSSLILYGVSGNDYAAFTRNNAGGISATGLPVFIQQVVAQIMADLRSLYALGFRNFAVTKLQPVGCLPTYTMAFDYTMCNDIVNTLTPIHNSLLDTELNLTMQLYMREANLIYLDMETVFNDILTRQPGFPTVLKPCCTPNFFTGLCGDVDISNNRQPLYSVCSNPSQAFFWDNNHPTSAGWQVVFERLLSSPIFTGGKSLPEFLLTLY